VPLQRGLGSLVTLLVIAAVVIGGVGGFVEVTAADAPPDSPTETPGTLQVSLLNESSETVSATFGVNTTSETINKTNATTSDVQVASINPDQDSALAIQFAIDNATDENRTVRIGSGTFNSSGGVSVGIEGLTLEGAEGASSTIIGQSSVAVTSTAANVEIADLRIENPEGSRAVKATNDATGVVIQNNTVTNVNINNNADQPRGIIIGGLDGGDSADGLEIRNNTVTNVVGGDADDDQAHAIQILEESRGGGLIENVVVDGNTVESITDTRSTAAVQFNGKIEGEITNNDISGLNTEGNPDGVSPGGGFTQVIALSKGGNAADGPQNVTIEGNDISGIETTTTENPVNFAPPYHVLIGSEAEADSISIKNNSFSADSVDPRDDVYIGDKTGELDLNAILNERGNTFSPKGTVIPDGDSIGDTIRPEGTVPADTVVNLDNATTHDKIQDAVDDAQSGHTLRVGPGTYREDLDLDKGVSLISASSSDETTIAVGSGERVDFSAAGAVMVDFKINKTSATNTGDNTILISEAGTLTNSDIVDHSSGATGIEVSTPGGEVKIENNGIDQFDAGVDLTGTTHSSVVNVTGNDFTHNGDGVRFSDSGANADASVNIHFNTFENNADGIAVTSDPSASVRYNLTLNDLIGNNENGLHIEGDYTDDIVNAKYNWWGSDAGPNSAAGDSITTASAGDATTEPFLLQSAVDNYDDSNLGGTNVLRFGHNVQVTDNTGSVAFPAVANRTAGESIEGDTSNVMIYKLVDGSFVDAGDQVPQTMEGQRLGVRDDHLQR
jgi:hypothetical protein